jgi:hypothetical protein
MKKLKVSFAAFAFFIAIGLSAFTSPAKPTTNDAWFVIDDPANPNLAASYSYIGTSSPCSSNDHLCAIKGVRDESDNNRPTQTSVNAASLASSNFANPVANQVSFDMPE